MNRFMLKNTFIKIYIYHILIKYFYKNKESKLDLGHCVVILSDFFYGVCNKNYFILNANIFI